MGERVAIATGAELWVDVVGSGPPVVLIHGNMGSSKVWDPQIEPLSERFTVVRYDVRGFGESPLAPGRHSDREDLRALLEALGIERPHIVGLSMGADIALDVELAHPGLARSLVVVPGGIEGNEPPDWLTGAWPQIEAAIAADDFRQARDVVMDLPPMRSLRRQPKAEARMIEIIDEHPWRDWVAKWPAYDSLQPPAYGRIGELDLPILAISGALEVPEFIAEAEYIARTAPHGDHVVIPDAGHCVNMEAPAAFNQAVIDFVLRVEQAAGSVRP